MHIPSQTRYLRDVRRFVEEHAATAGFSARIVEQCKLAMDEACTNIIKHAYEGSSEGMIEVEIAIGPKIFQMTLKDTGLKFITKEYQPPDLVASIKKRAGGGYGVHLMRRLMDDVRYENRKGVNIVRLIKFRDSS